MKRKKYDLPPKAGWAIYLRTSDKDAQNPENSQRRQRHAIERMLLAASDLPVIKEYVDNQSGRSTGNREGYQQMLKDARAGRFSMVAVENAERFGRNDAEALPVIDELHELGIAVRFADYPDLDPVDPDDRVMVSLSFSLARRESIKISQRSRGGMHAKMRAGGYIGNAPDGYVHCEHRTGGDSTLESGRYKRWIELDPEQSKIWRLAWDLLLTGQYSLADIANELHARGHTFRSGKPFVTVDKRGNRKAMTNRLSKIFNNWTYAGWVTSKAAKIPPKTIRGNWEALVTTEEFEQGLKILKSRYYSSVRKNNEYLLSKLIYLRYPDGDLIKMGCQTTRNKDKGLAYYIARMEGVLVRCDAVDEQIRQFLHGIAIDPELVPVMKKHYTKDLSRYLQQPDLNLRNSLEKTLSEIDREEERTLRLYAAGTITEDIWKKLWHEWQDRRRSIVNRLDALDEHFEEQVDNLDAALTILPQLGVLYDYLELSQRKQLVRDIIRRVIVDIEGNVLRVDLHPPFVYLAGLMKCIQNGSSSAENARPEERSNSGTKSCGTLQFSSRVHERVYCIADSIWKYN